MSARSLLAPLTPLYRFGLALRERRLTSGREPVRRLAWPVLSIGNLSTGGSGKTPLTIALAQALTRRGISVDVLSRGYGRQSTSAVRARLDGSATQYGDEPLLIARHSGVPVYVAVERYQAGLLAETESLSSGFAVHLLDDGFQHRQLARDLDILLLSRHDWHDRLLPAGNLREELHAIRRASVVAIPAGDAGFEQELRSAGFKGPIWRLHRRMQMPDGLLGDTGAVVAFCGIARPQQFFAGVEELGLRLAGRIAFPDHHRYASRDLDRLRDALQRSGAIDLLTTEKDAVRLEGLAPEAAFPVRTVALRIEIEDEDSALDWIISRLPLTRPLPPA